MEPAHEEKRKFPRVTAECPVLIRPHKSNRWQITKLVDYSATGMSLICDIELEPDEVIEFEIKPEGNRMIPEIQGEASIVRCIEKSADKKKKNCYILCCQLLRVSQP